MIPADGRHQASFKYDSPTAKSGHYYISEPVVAWDDDGYALIARDDKSGRLHRAANFSNFAGVAEAGGYYVGAIPGGGWQVAWPEDDGSEYIEPVVAWVLKSDGTMEAVSVDSEGTVESVHGGKVKWIRPDGTRHSGDEPPTALTAVE